MLWIRDNQSLQDYCQMAQRHPVIAVDTEFVWVKTYYPKLGLIQLAYEGGDCTLVDALAITDPAPLKQLLENSEVKKVFHEAASDLPILRRWCGALPRNIFDTRIAAGFCGMTGVLSLSKLLNQLLGVELAKTETRTDWTQRPLTEAQLEYASEDVHYMPQACTKLIVKLKAANNLAWFEEEMRTYENPEYYEEIEPEKAWKRVSGMNQFYGRQLAILSKLAAWRERLARETNTARPRIMGDEQMVLAVQYEPKTIAELHRCTGMWAKSLEHVGAAVLECIQQGIATPTDQFPHRRQVTLDSRVIKQRADRVLALIRKRAEQHSIDSILVGSRKDAESLVLATEDTPWPFEHRLLSGWRAELLGTVIVELVQNKFAK